MRITAVIQARMDSKRLPGKVLMDLNGLPVIKHIWRRLLKCREIDEVVISWGCTCEKDETRGCMPCIERVTKAFGFMPRIWTGPEYDLVSRHLGAAIATRADAILRITGDCPFVDPWLADDFARKYRAAYPAYDVLANWWPRMHLPDGLDMEIQSVEMLQKIASLKEFPKEEYLGDMVKCGLFKVGSEPSHPTDMSDYRLTLDTQTDYERINRIFAMIGNDEWDWTRIPKELIERMERPDYLNMLGYKP